VRIHLGHHFYGAGNLGDDFMLAGFLGAMRRLAPAAIFTCGVPFALEPLRRRFPRIHWSDASEASRREAIAACDVWLGLGGSPFQCAHSRWFIDHLVSEAAACEQAGKPMFFLGIGVQTAAELDEPDVRRLRAQAAGIWTRDLASAGRLSALPAGGPIAAAADLAHVFFQENRPPPAQSGRVTIVANFDFGAWPGQAACLQAVATLPATEHVWLAQESRALPGAELALHAALEPPARARWKLVVPEDSGAPLPAVLARWPSGEWLVTARYHAAMAGAWSGSKVVVVATNEKLRAAAQELGVPWISPDADTVTARRALESAVPPTAPSVLADKAREACAEFVRAAGSFRTGS
jgi:hypothetical protein